MVGIDELRRYTTAVTGVLADCPADDLVGANDLFAAHKALSLADA